MNAPGVIQTLGRHQAWLLPVGIFILGLVVRLVYLNQIESLPTFYHPIMDERYHVDLAEQINADETPAEPFYRAPLYPYLLAELLRITEGSLYWARFIQVLLGAMLPLLVYALGVRFFNRRIAVWSALVAALYPTFLYYDAALLITSVMVLLTMLLVLQLHRTESQIRSSLAYVLAGLLLGVAGLARPNILLLGPALLLWMWLVLKPKLGLHMAALKIVLIGAAALVMILPVTIRNYVVGGDTVLIAWQGGFNFYLGNNQRGDRLVGNR